MKDNLYLGIKGSVVAIERRTGRELWRTHLKRGFFVVVMLDGDVLVAHTGGELFGLEPKTGAILWRNGLEGLGYGYVTMASENANTLQTLSAIRMMQQSQSSGGAAGASS